MPFHVVNHTYVVNDTGVKGQCLYTFLIHSGKATAQIFLVFTKNFWRINIFVLITLILRLPWDQEIRAFFRYFKQKTVITFSNCGFNKWQ